MENPSIRKLSLAIFALLTATVPMAVHAASDEIKAVAELEAEVNAGVRETRAVAPAPAAVVPSKVQRIPTAEIQPMVSGEFGRTQQDLQWELAKLKQRQSELERLREQARLAARAEAEVNKNGIKAFTEYDRLLGVRYSNKKNDFEPGMEIDAKEIENINRIFQSYLKMIPLTTARVSAGRARRTLAWGIERLEQLEDWNSSPDEKTNSDYEIIAKQLHDVSIEVERVMDLADKIDVKLNPDATVANTQPPESKPAAAQRAPAAELGHLIAPAKAPEPAPAAPETAKPVAAPVKSKSAKPSAAKPVSPSRKKRK